MYLLKYWFQIIFNQKKLRTADLSNISIIINVKKVVLLNI